MMKKKGQISIEYLVNYFWVFVIITIFFGVLVYLNFFDTQRFVDEYCNFDTNFHCTEMVVQKDRLDRFDMKLLIQNNMNRVIVVNTIEVVDEIDGPIECKMIEIFCPFDDNESYAKTLIEKNHNITITNILKAWVPTRLCKLEFDECRKSSYKQNTKQKFIVIIKFIGENSKNMHSSRGALYAYVQ